LTKAVNINPKICIYHNNGSGRDSFISKTCGGFYKSGNLTVHTYNYHLRNYDVKPVVLRNDYLKMTQNFIRKEVVPILNETSKKQRATSARLSKPKHITPKHFD
jgi:GT2 family glycosyltransferase